MKIQKLFMITLLVLIATGCAPGSSRTPQTESGLLINGLSSSIGGEDGDTSTQVFSYQVTLQNNSRQEVLIQSVEPVLSDQFVEKILNEDLVVQVGQVLPANTYIEVRGEFRFDAAGLSKEEIVEMEPFMTGLRVLAEQVIPLPGQDAYPGPQY